MDCLFLVVVELVSVMVRMDFALVELVSPSVVVEPLSLWMLIVVSLVPLAWVGGFQVLVTSMKSMAWCDVWEAPCTSVFLDDLAISC